MESNKRNSSPIHFEKIVDTLIRLGLLFLLLTWCIDILKPFILMLIWGAVISIALFPVFTHFTKLFRGKKSIAAIIITLIMISVIVIPSIILGQSLYNGIGYLEDIYKQGKPLIPPPNDMVANWPSIAKPIIDIWKLASEHLSEAAIKYAEELKVGGAWILSALAGISMGILQFIVSIIISGVLLFYSKEVSHTSSKVFTKLVGKDAVNFSSIIVVTIRNVVRGILGMAAIQSVLAGIGFFAAGVPFAGLWTIICLVLAIIQVGIGLIAIPIIIYMFSVTDTFTATIFTIWIGLVLLSDNFLKPILLGRGAPAPMIVVFLGAIGGLFYQGFLGLFLGAVILTLGYKLIIQWIEMPEVEN